MINSMRDGTVVTAEVLETGPCFSVMRTDGTGYDIHVEPNGDLFIEGDSATVIRDADTTAVI